MRGESERPSWELRGFYPCRPVPVITGPRPVSTYSKTAQTKAGSNQKPRRERESERKSERKRERKRERELRE